jgi:hypothetical protein
MQGNRVTQAVSRVARVGRELRLQDVMFGLMVIQQRLDGLESRLGEMEDRLGDIEHRIADLGQRAEPPSGVDEQGRHRSVTLDRREDPIRSG